MSYTNQDEYSTGITGNQNKLGGQYGSNTNTENLGTTGRDNDGSDQLPNSTYSNNGNKFNNSNQSDNKTNASTGDNYGSDQLSDPNYSNNANRFDNSGNRSNPPGGTHFGSSGDPNTFSTTGITSGSDNQQSGNYGSTTTGNTNTGDDGYGGGSGTSGSRSGLATRTEDDSTVSSSDYGVSGMSGAENRQGGAHHVKGTGYGNTSRNSDDLDAGGTTQTGATGTGYSSGDQNTRTGDNAYGNFSSDVGGAPAGNVPPEGLRGGANDPGYQPGTRYSYEENKYVSDDTNNNSGHGGKVGMGDKIKGTIEKVQGKLTKNPDLVQQGQARKTGNLDNDDNFSSGNTDEYGSSRNTDNQYGPEQQNQYGSSITGNQYGQGNNSSNNNDY